MNSDTDPPRRATEPLFLRSLPLSSAAPAPGAAALQCSWSSQSISSPSELQWEPGSLGQGKGTLLGRPSSRSSLASTWLHGPHLSELQLVPGGKERFVLDLFVWKLCPSCPSQNTFVTSAVDEGHSKCCLPCICLYNKINLFTIPYLNIYLDFELSNAICGIQSLMCFL